MIWGWAPGVSAFITPMDVGFLLSNTSADGITQITLQTHYDNPSKANIGDIDHSGIRIYYTFNLRLHDAGIFQTGDPEVEQRTHIGQGNELRSFEYSCPSQCTSQWSQEINVFANFLHMHAIGTQIWGTQWRGTQMIRETNRIDFWDFAFQQQTKVNYTILPGDRINTHCVYKQNPAQDTIFFLGSHDEMCIQYFAYYPRFRNDVCGLKKSNGINATECNGTILLDGGGAIVENPAVKDPVPEFPVKFGNLDSAPAQTCANPQQPDTGAAFGLTMTPVSILMLVISFALQ